MGIYDYSVERPDGTMQPLSTYEEKVLLIVNTATGCGFTPQYRELEEFYRKYHGKGLEILDIPCNQFAGQTPVRQPAEALDVHLFRVISVLVTVVAVFVLL